MSRYLERLRQAKRSDLKEPPEEALAAQFASRIDVKKNPKLLRETASTMQDLLEEHTFETLQDVLWWVFGNPDPFWRTTLREADAPNRMFYASLRTILAQFHQEQIDPSRRPKKITPALARLRSISPWTDRSISPWTEE